MKSISCFLLSIFSIISLTGCQDLHYDSLDEYRERVERNGLGNSNVEIDDAEYFLPSITFMKDYEYIDGNYYYYEDNLFCELLPGGARPEISFLYLKYEETVYKEAKSFMLKEIEVYNDEFYIYNDYYFYENSNFIASSHGRNIPHHFTMACYNDEKQILIFLGFYERYPGIEDKYHEDIKGNWTSFLDQYYSEYYNFND